MDEEVKQEFNDLIKEVENIPEEKRGAGCSTGCYEPPFVMDRVHYNYIIDRLDIIDKKIKKIRKRMLF